jgi:hypothetical protein
MTEYTHLLFGNGANLPGAARREVVNRIGDAILSIKRWSVQNCGQTKDYR